MWNFLATLALRRQVAGVGAAHAWPWAVNESANK